ncbi:fimbrial protein [Pseudomonas rubra]|uniref:Type 1 fimbrial protein n=1 Tax=Pseudomonas rubra TaxID=2942627 RepID=A0ABT5P9J4_9PSED|nr:fimbrial protein [Pseudomonas rubra]MDD1014984.1 type 1 fimbrial protein [Pseudomonas rubra]MDD1038105.1 type 1 fimbrial protein [Pseudomonas rubra]MDD1156618.1 type 1 fimbrial protein [Pseudomonas rubra]
MKKVTGWFGRCLLLLSACFSSQVHACFPEGFFKTLNISAGYNNVGRDTPDGTVFWDRPQQLVNFSSNWIDCRGPVTFQVTTPLAPIHGSPLVDPGEVLLRTPIPGIGLVMNARLSADGSLVYTPGTGRLGSGVPHTVSHIRSDRLVSMRDLDYGIRLIKIGPVQPGHHFLNGTTVMQIASDRNGPLMDVVISQGSVGVAQCSLPAAPGNQIRVPMGTWTPSDFAGEGAGTQHRAFRIALNDCTYGVSDPHAPGVYAHMRLDPRNGSTVIDAPRGILGLSSDSTASGVGVQVLKSDLTPLALLEELPIERVGFGTTWLDLAARYIQAGADRPDAGTANAAAGFTITYK